MVKNKLYNAPYTTKVFINNLSNYQLKTTTNKAYSVDYKELDLINGMSINLKSIKHSNLGLIKSTNKGDFTYRIPAIGSTTTIVGDKITTTPRLFRAGINTGYISSSKIADMLFINGLIGYADIEYGNLKSSIPFAVSSNCLTLTLPIGYIKFYKETATKVVFHGNLSTNLKIYNFYYTTKNFKVEDLDNINYQIPTELTIKNTNNITNPDINVSSIDFYNNKYTADYGSADNYNMSSTTDYTFNKTGLLFKKMVYNPRIDKYLIPKLDYVVADNSVVYTAFEDVPLTNLTVGKAVTLYGPFTSGLANSMYYIYVCKNPNGKTFDECFEQYTWGSSQPQNNAYKAQYMLTQDFIEFIPSGLNWKSGSSEYGISLDTIYCINGNFIYGYSGLQTSSTVYINYSKDGITWNKTKQTNTVTLDNASGTWRPGVSSDMAYINETYIMVFCDNTNHKASNEAVLAWTKDLTEPFKLIKLNNILSVTDNSSTKRTVISLSYSTKGIIYTKGVWLIVPDYNYNPGGYSTKTSGGVTTYYYRSAAVNKFYYTEDLANGLSTTDLGIYNIWQVPTKITASERLITYAVKRNEDSNHGELTTYCSNVYYSDDGGKTWNYDSHLPYPGGGLGTFRPNVLTYWEGYWVYITTTSLYYTSVEIGSWTADSWVEYDYAYDDSLELFPTYSLGAVMSLHGFLIITAFNEQAITIMTDTSQLLKPLVPSDFIEFTDIGNVFEPACGLISGMFVLRLGVGYAAYTIDFKNWGVTTGIVDYVSMKGTNDFIPVYSYLNGYREIPDTGRYITSGSTTENKTTIYTNIGA